MPNNYSGISASLQRLALTALLAGGTTLAAQAQFTYTPGLASNIAGTYTDLGSNGTAITVANTDDANSAATDIGFTFNFNGTAFTQFVLNTNGLLRLGANGPAQALAASAYAQDPTTGPVNSGDAADTNLIMPFNFDLAAGTSRPEYRVYTTGTAGSRVCTIQWKNVSDKAVNISSTSATTIPTQFGNFSFQVKLYEGSNQVDFVYDLPTSLGTSGLKYVVVGLKGSAANNSVLASKNSSAAWSTTGFFTGPQLAPTTGSNANNIRSVAPPDAGRTYRFVQAVPNDAAVTQLYNIERVPAGQSYAYSAVVRNVGTTAITNAALTLTVSGANSATQTITIPSIPVGVGGIVTFSAVTLSASGTNNVSVALASDGNNDNNAQTGTTVTSAGNTTTAATFSYINPTASFPSSYGFNPSTTGATITNAFCAAFTPTAAFNVNVVRAQLGNDAAAVGQKVYGVVLDMNGTVLGRSPDFTIATADLNTLHTFTLQTPISIAAGTKFLVGLAQIVESTAFFPMAYQVETPSRTGTYYIAGISTPGTPTDITTTASYSIRYALEAGGLGTALATNSPALARAIDVYPNPSTSGVFSLDVRGASATAGLGVEVADQLGRRVYTGSARDNFATTLDLSSLAPGIYHLTLRNGDQFTSRRISIVK